MHDDQHAAQPDTGRGPGAIVARWRIRTLIDDEETTR
jgi:hypothetical protein